VQDAPLSLDEVVRAVAAESQGGLVTFTGAVRDHSHGKTVTKLEYEAYVPMAEKKLAEIGAEAAGKWPGTRVAVVHRVGTLLPGELAVVIAVSAPHRKEAFRACEYVIDRLKEEGVRRRRRGVGGAGALTGMPGGEFRLEPPSHRTGRSQPQGT
jgi:molybdopterin synthase catalytic subunit